jgi:hypothetical protein
LGQLGKNLVVAAEEIGEDMRRVIAYLSEKAILNFEEAFLSIEGYIDGSVSSGKIVIYEISNPDGIKKFTASLLSPLKDLHNIADCFTIEVGDYRVEVANVDQV